MRVTEDHPRISCTRRMSTPYISSPSSKVRTCCVSGASRPSVSDDVVLVMYRVSVRPCWAATRYELYVARRRDYVKRIPEIPDFSRGTRKRQGPARYTMRQAPPCETSAEDAVFDL